MLNSGETEEQFRLLFEAAPNGMIVTDHDGVITFVNRQVEKLFGYWRGELIGRSVEVLVPERFQGAHPGLRAQFAKQPETELREARLRQWQSLEAIGQITASVAHDFANLLTPIRGNLHLLEKQPDHPRSRSRITAALAAAERGEKLVRSLLAFARQEPLTITIIDVDSIVGQMKELLSEALGSVAALTIDLGPDIWPVKADESGLELAVINLVINSRDAITANGAVRVLDFECSTAWRA